MSETTETGSKVLESDIEQTSRSRLPSASPQDAPSSWEQTPAPLQVFFFVAVAVFIALVAGVIWAAATHLFSVNASF